MGGNSIAGRGYCDGNLILSNHASRKKETGPSLSGSLILTHVPVLLMFRNWFLFSDKIIKADFFSHNKAQCGKEHAEHHRGEMPRTAGS